MTFNFFCNLIDFLWSPLCNEFSISYHYFKLWLVSCYSKVHLINKSISKCIHSKSSVKILFGFSCSSSFRPFIIHLLCSIWGAEPHSELLLTVPLSKSIDLTAVIFFILFQFRYSMGLCALTHVLYQSVISWCIRIQVSKVTFNYFNVFNGPYHSR